MLSIIQLNSIGWCEAPFTFLRLIWKVMLFLQIVFQNSGFEYVINRLYVVLVIPLSINPGPLMESRNDTAGSNQNPIWQSLKMTWYKDYHIFYTETHTCNYSHTRKFCRISSQIWECQQWVIYLYCRRFKTGCGFLKSIKLLREKFIWCLGHTRLLSKQLLQNVSDVIHIIWGKDWKSVQIQDNLIPFLTCCDMFASV